MDESPELAGRAGIERGGSHAEIFSWCTDIGRAAQPTDGAGRIIRGDPEVDLSSAGDRSRGARGALVAALLLAGSRASAQEDEIQVYTGEIASPGAVDLTLHANYAVSGRTTSRFPGGIVPDGALNGALELGVGVTPWLELGLYLPVYTVTRDGEILFDGTKLRALFVTPHAESRRAYAGVNLELSFNAAHWDPSRVTGEVRFILGGRVGTVELTLNPILDTAFDGFGAISLTPAERLAWHASRRWTIAVEHYGSLGALDQLEPVSRQGHALFAVLDHDGSPAAVEVGVGFGLTDATDGLLLKLIVTPEL